jgi:hypothetical protein
LEAPITTATRPSRSRSMGSPFRALPKGRSGPAKREIGTCRRVPSARRALPGVAVGQGAGRRPVQTLCRATDSTSRLGSLPWRLPQPKAPSRRPPDRPRPTARRGACRSRRPSWRAGAAWPAGPTASGPQGTACGHRRMLPAPEDQNSSAESVSNATSPPPHRQPRVRLPAGCPPITRPAKPIHAAVM